MLFGRDRQTIRELREELKEARQELWMKDNAIRELRWWLAATPVIDARWITFGPEPTIKHRAPSDVFFIPRLEDLLK